MSTTVVGGSGDPQLCFHRTCCRHSGNVSDEELVHTLQQIEDALQTICDFQNYNQNNAASMVNS